MCARLHAAQDDSPIPMGALAPGAGVDAVISGEVQDYGGVPQSKL